MDKEELIRLAESVLGPYVDVSYCGEDHWPGIYDESAQGHHVLSYRYKGRHALGATHYIAIPKSGKPPFLLNWRGE